MTDHRKRRVDRKKNIFSEDLRRSRPTDTTLFKPPIFGGFRPATVDSTAPPWGWVGRGEGHGGRGFGGVGREPGRGCAGGVVGGGGAGSLGGGEGAGLGSGGGLGSGEGAGLGGGEG